MMETSMKTGETLGRTKPKARKTDLRTPTALRLTPELYRRMRERAAEEGLGFATWLKRIAIRELRRKPSL